jgi:hypothetical protein
MMGQSHYFRQSYVRKQFLKEAKPGPLLRVANSGTEDIAEMRKCMTFMIVYHMYSKKIFKKRFPVLLRLVFEMCRLNEIELTNKAMKRNIL